MTAVKGRFISFEGGEGAGKSTQITLLAEWLRARGVDAVVTREPGGTAGAEAIRTLLLATDGDGWNAQAEALLFAAARADHVARLIQPALAKGQWVLCDRFVDSTRAYQGAAGGISDMDICTLHRIGSGGLLPDRTFLLHMATDRAALRRSGRGTSDRFEAREEGYHARVVAAFHALATAEQARWRIIEGDGSIATVSAAIITAVLDMLP